MERRDEFLALFLRHQGQVEAFIHGLVRDRVAADDIVQEVALALWKEFDRYDSSRPFAPWARGVASNHVLRHFKARHKEGPNLSPEAVQAVLDASNRDAHDVPSRHLALRHCLESLPQKSQALLHLRFASGMKFEEMSAQLGSSKEAIRKAVARLRDGLRDCIQRRLSMQGTEA